MDFWPIHNWINCSAKSSICWVVDSLLSNKIRSTSSNEFHWSCSSTKESNGASFHASSTSIHKSCACRRSNSSLTPDFGVSPSVSILLLEEEHSLVSSDEYLFTIPKVVVGLGIRDRWRWSLFVWETQRAVRACEHWMRKSPTRKHGNREEHGYWRRLGFLLFVVVCCFASTSQVANICAKIEKGNKQRESFYYLVR